MECNKDEACRAREIAEKKFEAKDYLGAKKFALKAQSLYPNLEGVQHMLTTLEIYISSENLVNGESDWYKVLNVSSNADVETIRKQYRKLALVLHPDKNKSIGAEGAFKLISQAWNLLSDKIRRSSYDQRKKIINVKPNAPGSRSNNVSSSSKSASTPTTVDQKGKTTKRNSRASSVTPTAPPPHQQRYQTAPTFWTTCHRCRTQHEYLRKYLENNILCANCSFPFYAVECRSSTPQIPKMPPTPQIPKMPTTSQWSTFVKKQPGSTAGSSSSAPSNQPKSQWSAFSQEVLEKAKQDQEDKMNLMKRNLDSKREAGSSSDANAAKKRKVDDDAKGSKSQGSKISSSEPDKGGRKNKLKGSKDFPNPEISRKLLIQKARAEILSKVKDWKVSDDVAGAVGNTKKGETATETGKSNDSTKGHEKGSKLKSISVPDSDFHDFDKDRTEMSFGENQVWAVYDSDDGMPRYYALIQKVISVNPFKVRMSWLNSKTNVEFGPLNWVGSGFVKTCGEFRIGKREIKESVNIFSHKMRWTKGKEGIILVFPEKGDVWALYRNWSPKWNKLTDDKIIHTYDMVEVLDDYDEKIGVRVTSLIKVAGFRSVFRRHNDEKELKIIPREEMFRFSHQVPSVSLSGIEGENAPKGCLELDPASTPLDLLQFISDGNAEKFDGKKTIL